MTGSVGRSDEEKRAIVERIATRIEGGDLNAEACAAEGVNDETVRRWRRDNPALDEVYTRARLISADALAEEAVRVARSLGDPQSRRLEFDALRWLAGKRRPRDYGDRVDVEVGGTIGHLHLDALRAPKVSATVKLANPMASDDIAPPDHMVSIADQSVSELGD